MRATNIDDPTKDLRSVAKIGPGLAKVLYGVIATGEFPPSKWRGEARVAMWNTRTQKKVSTRSLPTEEGAEAWTATDSATPRRRQRRKTR